MTEAEWQTCSDPEPMLTWLHGQGKLSGRKARLFGVACCRVNWPLMTHPSSRRAVEIVEDYADKLVSRAVLKDALQAAWKAYYIAESERLNEIARLGTESKASVARWLAAELLCWFERDANWIESSDYPSIMILDDLTHLSSYALLPVETLRGGEDPMDKAAQAELLRDIFNPFSSVSSNHAWRTSEVVAFATTVYQHLSWDRLPDLANLLRAKDCDVVELLEHMAGPGPHTKGCWAIDLLLGKE